MSAAGYFHIRVINKKGESFIDRNLRKDDITALTQNFNKGYRISVGDGLVSPTDIESIRITETDYSSGAYIKGPYEKEYDVISEGKNVTNNFVTFEPQVTPAPVPRAMPEVFDQKQHTVYDPKKVFIVHGHDTLAKNELSNFLFRRGLQPITLGEEADRGMTTILQKFKDYADKVGYSFVLLTPDDVGSSKDAIQPDRDFLKPRARQNVILELGYLWGSWD